MSMMDVSPFHIRPMLLTQNTTLKDRAVQMLPPLLLAPIGLVSAETGFGAWYGALMVCVGFLVWLQGRLPLTGLSLMMAGFIAGTLGSIASLFIGVAIPSLPLTLSTFLLAAFFVILGYRDRKSMDIHPKI